MIFASVCSGIEAASSAWHPLGWRSSWLSEIDPFACSVLAHHYPDVPNLGDMTRIGDEEIAQHDRPDVLVGGTPCQSFSVAGLRKGMADPRGNLALVFLRLLERTRARWVVWENVPGVLSSAGGRDFGAFLGALGLLGYGWAYRVLDAQYFGLAQRRKRVFVVGCVGGLTNRAAAVLFERACLRGDPAPSREAGAGSTVGLAPCLRGRSNSSHRPDTEAFVADVAHAVTTHQAKAGDPTTDNYVATAYSLSPGREGCGDQKKDALFVAEQDTARTLTANCGADPSNHQGGTAVAYQCHGSNVGPMGTMRAGNGNEGVGVPFIPIAFGAQMSTAHWADDMSDTLQAKNPKAVSAGTGVRRLTPRECERLQGFHDDYTLVPHRGKPASDGPRYRALGNSMAVPVMAWIGKRIQMVEESA